MYICVVGWKSSLELMLFCIYMPILNKAYYVIFTKNTSKFKNFLDGEGEGLDLPVDCYRNIWFFFMEYNNTPPG